MGKLNRGKVDPDCIHQKMEKMEREINRLKICEERLKKLETIVVDQANDLQECWERVEDQDDRIKEVAHKSYIVTNFEKINFKRNAEA